MKRGRFTREILSRECSSFEEWFLCVTKTRVNEASYELENIWRSLSGYEDSVRLMPQLHIQSPRSFYLATSELVLMYTSEREPETVFWFTLEGERKTWEDWCFIENWPWVSPKSKGLQLQDIPKVLWPKIFGFIRDREKEVLLGRHPVCKWWLQLCSTEPMKTYFQRRFENRSLLEARLLYDRLQEWVRKRNMLDVSQRGRVTPESEFFWQIFMGRVADVPLRYETDNVFGSKWIIKGTYLQKPVLVRKKDGFQWGLPLDFNHLFKDS